jgi:hypothetical protein
VRAVDLHNLVEREEGCPANGLSAIWPGQRATKVDGLCSGLDGLPETLGSLSTLGALVLVGPL